MKHWFICFNCAKDKGGVGSGNACTAHRDICPYCKKEETLVSWTDFNWPNNKDKQKIADENWD